MKDFVITKVDCYIADSKEHIGVSAVGFSEKEATEKLKLNIIYYKKNMDLKEKIELKLHSEEERESI